MRHLPVLNIDLFRKLFVAPGLVLFSVFGFLVNSTDADTGNTDVLTIQPEFEEFSLSNGLKVIAIRDSRAPLVKHMLWYRVGSVNDPIGKSGLAHYLEHLMFRGTYKHPDGEFSKQIAAVGGEENALTSHDYTAYHQTVSKEHLGMIMALEADRMRGLLIEDSAAIAELAVIKEERLQRIDNNPNSRFSTLVDAMTFLPNPYGREIIGYSHEIASLTLDDVTEFYRQYYHPSNAVLVVVGDISFSHVRRLTEETYGKIPPSAEDLTQAAAPPLSRTLPQIAPKRVSMKASGVGSPVFLRQYLVPSFQTASGNEAEALAAFGSVLGGDGTGILYQKLVVEDPVAIAAFSRYYGASRFDNRFIVYAVPRTGITLEVLEEKIDGVIGDLVSQGIEEAELNRTKREFLATTIFEQDDVRSFANVIGSALLTGRTIEDVLGRAKRMQKLDSSEVLDVAEKFLRPERSVTGFLLPSDPEPDDQPDQGSGSADTN